MSVSSSIHTLFEDHFLDLAVYEKEGRVRLTGMMPVDSTGEIAPGPLAEQLCDLESISLAESFKRSVGAFVDAIQAGERPPTIGEHGLRLLELERAVVQAGESGDWVEV